MTVKTTYIQTLDGKTKIEWWEKSDFQGRSTDIYTMNDKLQAEEQVAHIPIPDGVVLCDFCNEKIIEFPVAVMGSYALCKKCYEDIKKEGEDKYGQTS